MSLNQALGNRILPALLRSLSGYVQRELVHASEPPDTPVVPGDSEPVADPPADATPVAAVPAADEPPASPSAARPDEVSPGDPNAEGYITEAGVRVYKPVGTTYTTNADGTLTMTNRSSQGTSSVTGSARSLGLTNTVSAAQRRVNYHNTANELAVSSPLGGVIGDTMAATGDFLDAAPDIPDRVTSGVDWASTGASAGTTTGLFGNVVDTASSGTTDLNVSEAGYASQMAWLDSLGGNAGSTTKDRGSQDSGGPQRDPVDASTNSSGVDNVIAQSLASTESSPTEPRDGDDSGLTFAQDHAARMATDPMNFGGVAGVSVDDVNGGTAPGAGTSDVEGGTPAMLGGTPGVQQVIINGTAGEWSPSQSLFYSSDENASGYPLEVQNGGQANIYVNGHVDPTTGNFVPGAPSGASLPPEEVDMARERLGYLNANYDTPGAMTGAWHDVKDWFGAASPLLSADQVAEEASIGSILASTAVDSSGVYDEFGLQTMQGAGPLWNDVVDPMARGVSTATAGMAEFKHGVQTELADEAQQAAHRADDGATGRSAMKQVFIDMMLPGSPQELALALGGGAVAGKFLGVVGGAFATNFPVLGMDVSDAVDVGASNFAQSFNASAPDIASALGEPYQVVMARRQIAQGYYEGTGWSPERIEGHIAGIDLTRPVDVVAMPQDTLVNQFQIPGQRVGGYFAEPGTSADTLGIDATVRVPSLFVTSSDVQVLRSTAADILDWNGSGRLFSGGGIQYFSAENAPFARVPQ